MDISENGMHYCEIIPTLTGDDGMGLFVDNGAVLIHVIDFEGEAVTVQLGTLGIADLYNALHGILTGTKEYECHPVVTGDLSDGIGNGDNSW